MTCRSYISLITVEPVIFLYMLAIFLEVSVVQDLISAKVYIKLTNVKDTDLCTKTQNVTFSNKVKYNETYKEEKASWILYNNILMYILNLFIAFYIGSWIDKFGRKSIMLIPPIGSIFATINFIIISNYLHSNVEFVLISSIFSGLSGGSVALIANCFGYISKITSGETRSKRIVLNEAMLVIGGTTGIYIGGAMLKSVGYINVFILELCIHVIVLVYIICRVQEINFRVAEEEIKAENICIKLFGVRHVNEMISTVFRQRENSKRCYIILSLLASFAIYYGLAVQIILLYQYVTDKPLEWTQKQYSYFYGANFAISGISLFVGLPLVYHYCHIQDTTVAILGISSRMIGLIFLSLAKSTVMMYICPVLFIFSEYSIPALRSILSKLVDSNEIGKILTFMASLQSITFLTGSAFNALYLYTPHYFCFALVAGFQGIALGTMIYLDRKLDNEIIEYNGMNEEIVPSENLQEVS